MVIKEKKIFFPPKMLNIIQDLAINKNLIKLKISLNRILSLIEIKFFEKKYIFFYYMTKFDYIIIR